MSGNSSLDLALHKLGAALSALDDAVERRLEHDHGRGNMEEEMHRIGGDRSKLAQSLDTAEARAAQLEEANREVSTRLVAAMETIRAVIARNGGG